MVRKSLPPVVFFAPGFVIGGDVVGAGLPWCYTAGSWLWSRCLSACAFARLGSDGLTSCLVLLLSTSLGEFSGPAAPGARHVMFDKLAGYKGFTGNMRSALFSLACGLSPTVDVLILLSQLVYIADVP